MTASLIHAFLSIAAIAPSSAKKTETFYPCQFLTPTPSLPSQISVKLIHCSMIISTLPPPLLRAEGRFTRYYSLCPRFLPFKTSRSPQISSHSHFLWHLLLPRPSHPFGASHWLTGPFFYSCLCLLPSHKLYFKWPHSSLLGRLDSLLCILPLKRIPADSPSCLMVFF